MEALLVLVLHLTRTQQTVQPSNTSKRKTGKAQSKSEVVAQDPRIHQELIWRT